MTFMSFSLVPQIDRSTRWINFAQTLLGSVFTVALFALLLFLHGISLWWLISLYLLTFSLWPAQRWTILLAATWSFLLVGPTDFKWHRINALFREAGINWQIQTTLEGLPLILIAMLFATVWIFLARRYSRVLQRPVLSLLSFYLVLMAFASYAPITATIQALLWSFLVVFGQYLWFVCYSLKECRAPRPVPLHRQFSHYLPFWYPTPIPYPKGSSYLKRIEAKTALEFAVCRLKGLKLLFWALWLNLFSQSINTICFGYGEFLVGKMQFKNISGIIQFFYQGKYISDIIALPFNVLPSYEAAFAYAVSGNPLAWQMNWGILIIDFLQFLIEVAFASHIIIAVIRMCGFNALRNTYRPLASKSIAEFWNRYFYYFKELLVEFFFYPTFFRYFKRYPVLRMYAGTMAAAFFGNFLFHFIRDIWFVIELGFFQAMVAFHTYFVYSFVLGNVIFLSQWRQEKTHVSEMGSISRFLAPVRVIGFYCLLTIFVDFRRESISDNIAFLMSLFPF